MFFCACSLEKREFGNYFLEPRSNIRLSTYLFTTKAGPLEQKLATSVTKGVSSAGKGKPTPVNKKKNKTKENDKTKKNTKSTKGSEAVTAKSSKEVQNNVVDSFAKKKHNYTKPSKKTSGSAGNKSAKKSETKRSIAETKDVNGTTSNHLHDGLGKSALKIAETSPAITTVSNEEHPLDYSPEAILVEEEDDLHEKTEINDVDEASASHLANTEKELDTDPDHGDLDAKEDVVVVLDDLDSFSDPPKRYQEGTVGGKLFKEQTVAEIDGYLYLGKVSFCM